MKRATLIVIAAVSGLLLSGCSGEEGSEGGVVEERIAALAALGGGAELSAFEKQVLDDRVVTQAEYDEAYAKFATCISGQGMTATDERDGNGFYLRGTQSAEFDALVAAGAPQAERDEFTRKQGRQVAECQQGTFGLIDAVYREQTLNPEGKDFEQGTVDCLVRLGVIEPTFTKADWQEYSRGASDVEIDFAAPGVEACVADPFGNSLDE